jgi:hypothetical protein
MPDEPNPRGRQMTLRESDGRIVPTKLDDQSSGQNPGNAGVGKAPRPLRDSDRTPSAPGGGSAVINRLDRIHQQLFELGEVQRFSTSEPVGQPEAIDQPDRDVSEAGCGETSGGWEPDALTAHVRICEGANSIVHGSNIVTPPEETGGQQGKKTVS